MSDSSPRVHQVTAPSSPQPRDALARTNGRAVEASGLTLEWVRVADMILDLDYQRATDPKWLTHLTRNFAPVKCAALVVSRRDPTKNAVVAGGHRFLAAKANGVVELPCLVLHGLSLADEARIFLSEDHRKPLTPLAKWKARTVEGDETAINVNAIMAEYDLVVGNAGNKNAVACVVSIEGAYISGTLRRVLGALTGASWETRHMVASVVKTLRFMYLHWPEIDDARLARVMIPLDWPTFRRGSVALHELYGTRASVAFLVAQYNKKLRANRLDVDRITE